MVAQDGWKLLPDYRFDLATGLWHHREGPVEPPLRLDQVGYGEDGEMTYPRLGQTADVDVFSEYLDEAALVFSVAGRRPTAAASLGADLEGLRWL